MYRYDEFDEQMVRDRVAQFRGQVERRLSGELDEDHFKPLRLQNGVYLQMHAYMLRIAIPYGQLSSKQMRTLADVGEKYDKGYGHFTTRQNIQFNWIALKDIPTVLEELANVEMHAIQTSGNCIRNVTTDQFAGATAEEIEDPRPWCEIIRQWSTFHPEFAHLPRKFKIAVTAAETDRAAIRVHDIGLHMKHNAAGEVGFEIIVGGGLGRTPIVGTTVKDWVAKDDILDWLEAIMRVYNLHGRRDNKYKARIKILVTELTPEVFTKQVDAEFEAQRDEEKVRLPQEEVDRISDYFKAPAFETLPATSAAYEEAKANDEGFAKWTETNLSAHKVDGYTSVTVSLKPLNVAPGDATSAQMRVLADIAKAYSFDDLRVTHIQNIVLPHIKLDELYNVYLALDDAGLGADNVDLASDLICCPGLDYCNLANARSIPVAMEIQNMFSKYDRDLGKLHINISGCINACGHHHVGNIGILGVDKKGEEFYQITFGGRADEKARIGDIQGPGLRQEEVTPALERVAQKYLEIRQNSDEKFISTLERLGAEPFKEALYADS
ncbi:nitrite/sulfite reductase [Hirschia maritima]|uniref:nitrite/sulfite reductase n=1 Tax=Hirschia maritima TaxID=1121961 RepID=UPI00035F8D8F|nr:nitrite/sulfite reductase [Hirschia maritima]